jgi:hypothetical protein
MTILIAQPAPNTYNFNPAASDIVLYAFSLLSIRPYQLQLQHYIDAAMAVNFSMVNLSNYAPQQFAIENQTVPLIANTATYNLTSRTIAVPLVTIMTNANTTSQLERTIGPLSRYEYGAIPIKTQQGPVVSYFFDLAITPQINFWLVPDDADTYTAIIQTIRQQQDVDLTNDQGIGVPYRFLDYIATDMAARLADSYQPSKSQDMRALAKERLMLAISRDMESSSITLGLSLSNYRRIR